MTGKTYQGRAFIFNRQPTYLDAGIAYDVLESDQLLSCDTTLGSIDINLLPIGAQWDYEYKLYVLDLSGTSSTNSINVYAPVDHLINGKNNVTINNNYGSTLIRAVDSKNYITEFGRVPEMCYGAFYDTTTQTAATTNVAYAMKLNSISSGETNGVTVNNNTGGTPTQITVSKKGIYNIQFSSQLYRTAGGTKENIAIWFRKNEVDIPWSSTQLTLEANSIYLVAAWNTFISLDENDYVELMWTTTDDRVQLFSEVPLLPSPEIPSVIVTINKIN